MKVECKNTFISPEVTKETSGVLVKGNYPINKEALCKQI